MMNVVVNPSPSREGALHIDLDGARYVVIAEPEANLPPLVALAAQQFRREKRDGHTVYHVTLVA